MCKVYIDTIKFTTSRRYELVDITSSIERIVEKSGIRRGLCLVFAPHATGAIVINEHEPGLMNDILEFLKDWTEPERKWRHNEVDDNAHAHLASSMIGAERILPVVDGKVFRGRWQNVFFVEMDGPRAAREVLVVVLGERD